jgi:hypothetical protein
MRGNTTDDKERSNAGLTVAPPGLATTILGENNEVLPLK